MTIRIHLKPGRERALVQRHPWVFSGAVARIDGEPAQGALGEVVAQDGRRLARGMVNPTSQILFRVLSWDADEPIDAGFWRRKLERAIAGRAGESGSCRLVNAENDGLPGLIVDRYRAAGGGDWLVVQVSTAGIERAKGEIVAALGELAPARGIHERSDLDIREKEGLPPATGPLAGEPVPAELEMEEPGTGGAAVRLPVDLIGGHKSGAYLDQRLNRASFAARTAGRAVLNAFAYTGGFGLHALAAGAEHVLNIEESAPALAVARRAAEANGFGAERFEMLEGNAFHELRRLRDAGRSFGAAVLDPPKLVFSAGQIDRASRAYKDINLLAIKLLQAGGILATFSCSGLVSADLFRKIVFSAAVDAGREVQVLEQLAAPPDHPVLLSFPEGEYLKGLVCRVL